MVAFTSRSVARAGSGLDPLRLLEEEPLCLPGRSPPALETTPQVVDVGPEERVDGDRQSLVQDADRPVELAGQVVVDGRLEETMAPLLVGRRKARCPLERHGGCRGAAPPASVPGGVVQRLRDVRVGGQSRVGEVPCPPSGISLAGEHTGQRGVGGPALGRGGSVVDRGAKQRVEELELRPLD